MQKLKNFVSSVYFLREIYNLIKSDNTFNKPLQKVLSDVFYRSHTIIAFHADFFFIISENIQPDSIKIPMITFSLPTINTNLFPHILRKTKCVTEHEISTFDS